MSSFYIVKKIVPLVMVMAISPAAATTTISSSAFGISSDVGVVSTVAVTVGPTAAVAGTASPAYSDTGTLASLNANVGLGNVLGTTAGLTIGSGLNSTAAAGNGVLPGDTTFGSADALINNLGIGLFTKTGVFPAITTLSIGADILSSQTTVSRTGATAILLGQSNFTNLSVDLLGLLNVGFGANVQFAPNFILYNLLGLKITLNEQIAGGNGSNIMTLATNALRLTLKDFALGGRLLTGDVIVGHSEASINLDPLPEPAIWLEMIVGFGFAGSAARMRRKVLA